MVSRRPSAPGMANANSVRRYGDDGAWSAVSIRVGTPQQWLDVMVSTVSSETWVVNYMHCDTGDCSLLRGGTFNASASTSWEPLGTYSLDANSVLGNDESGEYGLDVLEFGSNDLSLPNAVIGAFNDPGVVNSSMNLLGYFGLGNTPGAFRNGTLTEISPISMLLEDLGAIPSHSYAYTAGASYRE
jgi:hypothetical protein